MWVGTYSVFWDEKLTTQEITTRELVQLLDRPEWAYDIATEVSNFNCRDPPPIQLLSEIGITGAYWLRTLESVQTPPPPFIFPLDSTSLDYQPVLAEPVCEKPV